MHTITSNMLHYLYGFPLSLQYQKCFCSFFPAKWYSFEVSPLKENADCTPASNHAGTCAYLQHAKRHTLLNRILTLAMKHSLLAFFFWQTEIVVLQDHSLGSGMLKPDITNCQIGGRMAQTSHLPRSL